MKSRSLHNSTKKGFLIFLTVSWRPFMKYHSPLSFPSLNITKNADTPTLYALWDYWRAPISNHWLECWKCITTKNCRSLCGERKLTYESDFELIFLNYGTYRTQIWLNFMEILYLIYVIFEILKIRKDFFFHLISCLKVKVEITCNLHYEKNEIKVTWKF